MAFSRKLCVLFGHPKALINPPAHVVTPLRGYLVREDWHLTSHTERKGLSLSALLKSVYLIHHSRILVDRQSHVATSLAGSYGAFRDVVIYSMSCGLRAAVYKEPHVLEVALVR